MNTTTTTDATIVAEIATVQMPKGRALVTVFRVPDDRLDETAYDWSSAGFWVGEDEFEMPEDGFDDEAVDEIVGRILGADVDMRLDWEDGKGTEIYRGRVTA